MTNNEVEKMDDFRPRKNSVRKKRPENVRGMVKFYVAV